MCVCVCIRLLDFMKTLVFITYFNFIKGTEREREEKDCKRQIAIERERERKEIVKDREVKDCKR